MSVVQISSNAYFCFNNNLAEIGEGEIRPAEVDEGMGEREGSAADNTDRVRPWTELEGSLSEERVYLFLLLAELLLLLLLSWWADLGEETRCDRVGGRSGELGDFDQAAGGGKVEARCRMEDEDFCEAEDAATTVSFSCLIS